MKTDEIQDEIERTRGEMETTLNAIEQRLSPRQLMDQAVDTMREFASDQSRVGAVVRDNPIPLALIGLGIGWLAISTMSGRRGRDDEVEYGSYESYEGIGAEAAPSSAWGSPGGLETTSSADYGYGTGASGAAYAGYASSTGSGGNGQGLRERAGDVASQAREGVSRATDRTRQRVSEWSRSARSQASMAADRTWEAYQEHPITMGFMAMMMGAAIGAILPRSRREEEMLGGSARGMMRQARQAAGDLAERAGHVAEKAVEAARHQGSDALREVGEATKEEARRQGLAGSGTSSSGSATTGTGSTAGGSTMTH